MSLCWGILLEYQIDQGMLPQQRGFGLRPMDHLPTRLYGPAQVRELDRIAIEEHGIPGYELMCRAGQVAFNAARERFPAAGNWLIVCGSGNNGARYSGDGNNQGYEAPLPENWREEIGKGFSLKKISSC